MKIYEIRVATSGDFFSSRGQSIPTAPRDVVFAGSLAEVLKFIKAELGKLEYKASEGK